MTWSSEEINNCIAQCKEKALRDKEFRKLLLADPGAAVKNLTGKDIPADFRVKVIESDPEYDVTFVLPPLASAGISDKELDNVTGGSALCAFETCAMNACGADK